MSHPAWRLKTPHIKRDYTPVCIFCRFASSDVLPHLRLRVLPARRSSKKPSPLTTPGPLRQFHVTSATSAPATSSRIAGDALQEYNFSINGGAQTQPPTKLPSTKSQIRNSLRAWGSQNEEIMRQTAPERIESDGRISRLPNALFAGNDSHRDELQRDLSWTSSAAVSEQIHETSQLMQPGTLLWYTGLGSSGQFAVYAGNVGVQSLLALESGSWAIDRLLSLRKTASDVSRMRVPDFLSAEELEKLKEHMPRSNIARPILGSEASSTVSMKGMMPPELIDQFMAKMRDFRNAFNDHVRDFSEVFNDGYLRVAADKDYRSMNIRDFLSQGYGMEWHASSYAKKLAVLHHISEQDSVTPYQTAEEVSLLILSKAARNNFRQVIDWARHYQDSASQAALGKDVTTLLDGNPLTTFIDKSRRLILLSRKTRSPTVRGGLGPVSFEPGVEESKSQKVPTGADFTEIDQLFIDFIWTMCFRLPLANPNGPLRFLPIVSLILRAVGAYPDLVLDHTIARLFLKEIGCADPWAPRSYDLALPLPNGKASQTTDGLQTEMKAFESHFNDNYAAEDLAELDSMKHIRKEWGSLAAFAIDPAESQLREDAISIEPAKGLSGAYWVHVHVSHVTAFFEPGSVVDRFARNLGASFISVDKSVRARMLPRTIAEHFKCGQGSPVLTISTLIDQSGTSVDVQVAAGKISNVINITPDAVNEVLGIQHHPNTDISTLQVGGLPRREPPTKNPGDIATARKYESELKNLSTVLKKRSQRRVEELPEPVSLPRFTFDLDVHVAALDQRDDWREQKSYHWKGDPGILLKAQHSVYRTTELRRASDIVAQAMRLASESMARWLDAREIPVVFVGTEPIADNSFTEIARKKPHEQFLMPLFKRSSTPVAYLNYHLKSYCSCTSPLRRYVDMIALWQVDSYLKAEALGLIEPGAPIRDEKMLNFSRTEIEHYLRVDAHAMETVDHTLRRIKETHVVQALFRAFHFQEAPLPKQWEVLVLEPAKLSASLLEKPATGHLIPFGSACEIRSGQRDWDKMAQHGQYLPVTIEAVDTERLVVQCRAAGPPKNVQTLCQPIQAVSTTQA